jgi:hypothetical protein
MGMEKRREVEEELSQIDEELEELFERFADLISRRKRLMREHKAKSGASKSIEKRSPTYVRHHKR